MVDRYAGVKTPAVKEYIKRYEATREKQRISTRRRGGSRKAPDVKSDSVIYTKTPDVASAVVQRMKEREPIPVSPKFAAKFERQQDIIRQQLIMERSEERIAKEPSLPPEDIYERARRQVRELPEKIGKIAEPWEKTITKHEGQVPPRKAWVYPAVFGAGVASGAAGLLGMATHPVETVKGLGHAITHPRETGKKVLERIQEHPIMSAGELAAYYGAGKLVQKAIQPKVVGSKEAIAIGRLKGKPAGIGAKGGVRIYLKKPLKKKLAYKDVGVKAKGYELFMPEKEVGFEIMKGEMAYKGKTIAKMELAAVTKFQPTKEGWIFGKYAKLTVGKEVYTSKGMGYMDATKVRMIGVLKKGVKPESLTAQETYKLLEAGMKEAYYQKGVSLTKAGAKIKGTPWHIKTPTIAEKQVMKGGIIIETPKVTAIGDVAITPTTPKVMGWAVEKAMESKIARQYAPIPKGMVGAGLMPKIKEIPKEIVGTKISPITLPKLEVITKPEIVSTTKPKVVPITEPIVTPRVVPRTAPRVIPKVIPKIIPKVVPRVIPKIVPVTIPPPPPPIPPPFLFFPERHRRVRREVPSFKIPEVRKGYAPSLVGLLSGKKIKKVPKKKLFAGIEIRLPIELEI